MVPSVFPVSGRQLTTDQFTAGALVVAVGCWLARRIWIYVETSNLHWGDFGLVVAVAIVLSAVAMLLLFPGRSVGRMVGGVAAGIAFFEQFSTLFGSFDSYGGTSLHWWDWGGWLTIPGALFALGAIAALLRAVASDTDRAPAPQRVFS